MTSIQNEKGGLRDKEKRDRTQEEEEEAVLKTIVGKWRGGEKIGNNDLSASRPWQNASSDTALAEHRPLDASQPSAVYTHSTVSLKTL